MMPVSFMYKTQIYDACTNFVQDLLFHKDLCLIHKRFRYHRVVCLLRHWYMYLWVGCFVCHWHMHPGVACLACRVHASISGVSCLSLVHASWNGVYCLYLVHVSWSGESCLSNASHSCTIMCEIPLNDECTNDRQSTPLKDEHITHKTHHSLVCVQMTVKGNILIVENEAWHRTMSPSRSHLFLSETRHSSKIWILWLNCSIMKWPFSDTPH
jgi:hypothetical protein